MSCPKQVIFSALEIRLGVGLALGITIFSLIVITASYFEYKYPWPPFRRKGSGGDIEVCVE